MKSAKEMKLLADIGQLKDQLTNIKLIKNEITNTALAGGTSVSIPHFYFDEKFFEELRSNGYTVQLADTGKVVISWE